MKKILILFILALIVLLAYLNSINSPLDEDGEDMNFIITKGEGVKKIAQNLQEQDIIDSSFFFKIYVWQKDLESKFQAGEYILNPSMSIKKIVNKITGGEVISNEKNITIIEGWNLFDIGQYFEREGMFQSEEFLEMTGYPKIDYRYNDEFSAPKDYSAQFDFLKDKPSYYSLEGYLFPDTYRVFSEATIDEIIQKILQNFDKKLTQAMRDEIKRQGKSVYEIITMASIIEKEVKSEKDMKIVSGIFWDRITNGQALESCATLAYILEVNKPQYTQEDTKVDSPYNTYQNRGLPPGPIGNPGLKAIKAAIYPEYTDYNYFLSRPDTGETVFSSTYQEHINNKAKYLN